LLVGVIIPSLERYSPPVRLPLLQDAQYGEDDFFARLGRVSPRVEGGREPAVDHVRYDLDADLPHVLLLARVNLPDIKGRSHRIQK